MWWSRWIDIILCMCALHGTNAHAHSPSHQYASTHTVLCTFEERFAENELWNKRLKHFEAIKWVEFVVYRDLNTSHLQHWHFLFFYCTRQFRQKLTTASHSTLKKIDGYSNVDTRALFRCAKKQKMKGECPGDYRDNSVPQTTDCWTHIAYRLPNLFKFQSPMERTQRLKKHTKELNHCPVIY